MPIRKLRAGFGLVSLGLNANWRIQCRYDIEAVGTRILVAGADRAGTQVGSGVATCRSRTRADQTPGTARAGHVRGDHIALWTSGLHGAAESREADVWACRAAVHLSEDAAAVNEVIRAAAELQAVCEEEGWRFCFIGGLAVQRWGEPRETVDVDLTLLTGFSDEDRYISALISHFEPRIENATEFARVNRVLLLRTHTGVGLDIALGGLPFEVSCIERSSLFTFPPHVALRICSAEDLIVLKAFADRPKDWVDVDGIIIRQGGGIDWPYVHRQLAPLAELKDAPDIVDRLERRRLELDS